MHYMFTQVVDDTKEFTQATWILIDIGSTFNSVCNADLLHDVVPCAPMRSLSNGGSLMYNKSGHLSLLPYLEVYYNPDSIANLLSMAYVTENYRVTMDSAVKKFHYRPCRKWQQPKISQVRQRTILLRQESKILGYWLLLPFVRRE